MPLLMNASIRRRLDAVRLLWLAAGIVGLGVVTASERPAASCAAGTTTNSTPAWFKTCRPHLEWVNWDRNLDVKRYADTHFCTGDTLGRERNSGLPLAQNDLNWS